MNGVVLNLTPSFPHLIFAQSVPKQFSSFANTESQSVESLNV